MNILYIGDIMAGVGQEVIEKILPRIKKQYKVDLTIAQSENVTNGKGISVSDYLKLRKSGIDFLTGGNHSFYLPEIYPYLNDKNEPIIRPANYPKGTTGLGWKYINTNYGDVLIISLLGQIVGKDSKLPMDNPLKIIDQILLSQKEIKKAAIIVNFHGDYSSEKVVIGQYLDGIVTAVIGDHWHVPTNDARVLPLGTAHITDVGMCGVLNSSLGVKTDSIIQRWHDNVRNKNQLETTGPRQFNALVIESNIFGLANNVQSINEFL